MKNNKVLAGWMILGLIIVGIFGLIAAFFSFVNEFNYVGVGVCLFAAAYAFSRVLKTF